MNTKGENFLLIVVFVLLIAFLFGYYKTEKKVKENKYPEPDMYAIVVSDKFNVYYGIYHVRERNWSTKRLPDTCLFEKQKAISLVEILTADHMPFIFQRVRIEKFKETVDSMKKR